jgi:hypothetical protein
MQIGYQGSARSAAHSSVVRTPASSWAAMKPPSPASGARSVAELSRKTLPTTSFGLEHLNRRWYERNPERHALRRIIPTRTGAYLCFLALGGFRRRTPGPPPFSSINSTPARRNTASIAASVVASPAYRPTSILVIVFRWRPVASARSRTVQFSAARAILTCALVTAHDHVPLSHVPMPQ